MIKRFHLISIILAFIILPSCSLISPTSPDISGDVGDESFPPINIASPSPDPLSQEIGTPSPSLNAEPSTFENQGEDIDLQIIVGTYSNYYHTDRNSTVQYIDWLNVRDMYVYVKDNVVMSELDVLTLSFEFIFEKINDNTFTLSNHEGDELVFIVGSDVAKLNGENVSLDAPIEYVSSQTFEDGKSIFIPLNCVAKTLGLNTMTNEYSIDNREYLDLRISKSGILSEEEFVVNENFVFLETREMDDGNGIARANIYALNENGETYSGVKLGSKYEDIILIFGEPQYSEVFASDEKCIISYDLNPEDLNEYSDGMQFLFSDGILKKVELQIYVWDD